MKRSKLIRFLKKLHKWPAIIIAFIAIIFAMSGIVMNHRQTFSSIDVSRNLLPENYRYNNWNQSAVRGAVKLDDTRLIYGNIGVWKSEDGFKTFGDFNQGFPKGIDNRKIYSIVEFNNTLYAGTQFGLFKRTLNNSTWEKIKLPLKKERVVDLELKEDALLVLTRNYLLESSDGNVFKRIQLPQQINYQRKAGLFKTFWELHSGELFGLAGKLLVDLLGLVTIILSITGLLHFFFPKIIKRRKKKQQETSSLVKTKKNNLRWHNVLGYVFAFFLLINTFAGIHLRPPLLIAIATKKVSIIPGTHLDNENPWFDKLRRVHWNQQSQQYLFSTSEGFFTAEQTLTQQLEPTPVQPPVSVMGCNVLESLGNTKMLVGSFSGLFVWDVENGSVRDYFSGNPYQVPQGMTRPIGANMATGIITNGEKAWWFDYNRGAIDMNAARNSLPEMPDEIRKAAPMSLWNVSLEMHTGRIFESLIGSFYILIVPLAGLCMMLVLISGVFIWWMVYRKR